MYVHVPRPFHLCREITEFQTGGARGGRLAHAAFPQFLRPFRQMEGQLTLQIALCASGPYDIPKLCQPRHKCACYA